jgi:hypothetical protein
MSCGGSARSRSIALSPSSTTLTAYPYAPKNSQSKAPRRYELPNSQLFADTASASRWIGEKLSLDPRAIQRAVLELVFAE